LSAASFIAAKSSRPAPDRPGALTVYYRAGHGGQSVLPECREHGRTGRRRPAEKVNRRAERFFAMPSLFRFLIAVAVIGGVIYGGIFALANFVHPKPREITVTIPPDRFLKK
jgi:hypothetical protein